MGLGPYPLVSLAEARQKALDCRKMRTDGDDPLERRASEKAEKSDAARKGTALRECAEQIIRSHEVAWKNPKHRQQWRNTSATYAYPVIGDVAAAEIDVPSILSVLEPIWMTHPETASRLRGRLEAIFGLSQSQENEGRRKSRRLEREFESRVAWRIES